MAGVTARVAALLVFVAVYSHLSAKIVDNHAYYRYLEYRVYEGKHLWVSTHHLFDVIQTFLIGYIFGHVLREWRMVTDELGGA
jgi:hypothetical protein